MLDRDLAELYGVKTKVLNQAVKRNMERFPERFMFRLVETEMRGLVTNCDRFRSLKHSSVPMYALDRGNLLPNGILQANTEYDSIRMVTRLVESAKSELVIIDPYSDATTTPSSTTSVRR